MNAPPTVHQYHYTASPHDAVTNHMRLIQSCLREQGYISKLFCSERDSALKQEFLRLPNQEIIECELLLIHHSHGNPHLQKVLATKPRKALIYHNITPEKFWRQDPYIESLCKLGRRQLLLLRENVFHAFSVSEFNRGELKALGFKSTSLLPLLDLSQKSPTLRSEKKTSPLTLLFVGKLVRHKNQATLIKSLPDINTLVGNEQTCLWLVGGREPLYGRYLSLLTKKLGVEHQVKFFGKVDSETLSSCFENASAFVCVSEHEGFCVPLVEALMANIPILAYANTGVTETLGSAGTKLSSLEPRAIARELVETLSDKDKVTQIRDRQNERFSELKRFQSRKTLVKAISGIFNHLNSSDLLLKENDETPTTSSRT